MSRGLLRHELELAAEVAGSSSDAPLGLPLAEACPQPGETLGCALERLGWVLTLPTVCRTGDVYWARSEWDGLIVADWDEVVLVSRPLGPPGAGGGTSTAKSVGAVVGLVALAALAPYVLGPAVLGLSATMASVLGAVVVAGGSALVSHFLRPKPAGRSSVQSDVYTFAFSGNTARPLQAVPVQYGRRLSFPDFAAPTYSEYDGDLMIDYALFSLGCGKLSLEEIRIGDTIIWTSAGGLDDSFYGTQLGFYQPGDQVNLFPVNVVTSGEVSGIEVGMGWAGGFAANPAGTLAREILIDLVWPSGAYQVYKERTIPTGTSIEFQARAINDAGTPTSGWFDVLLKEYSFAKQSQIRVTERIVVGAGRWEIRLRRINPSITGVVIAGGKITGTDTVTWTALRSHIDGPQSFPVTTLAIRTVASAGLSGLSSGKLGVVATRILPVWNGTDLAEQPTRSIAWAALDAWRSDEYSAGLPLTNVDFSSFVALDALWTSLGHSFDHVFTEPVSLDEALETILRAGRAMPSFVGDKLTIVRDQPRGIPAMMFNDLNIVRNSLVTDYILADSQFADGTVGQYFDETTWRLADVNSAGEGVILAKPATIELVGVVRRSQAAGMVRFYQATHQGRRVKVSWTTGAEGKLLKIGDLVTVCAEEPETWGQSAEVVRWEQATRRLWVSPTPDWGGYATCYLQVQRRNGSPWGPFRVTMGASASELIANATDLSTEAARQGTTLWSALSARRPTDELPLADFSPGTPRSYSVLVTEGIPDEDGEHMTLRGVADDPSVYDVSETGVAPLPTTPLVLGSGLPVIIAIGLTAIQRGLTMVLMAGWQPATGALTYKVEISYDEGASWLPIGEFDRTTIETVIGSSQKILLRVAGRNAAGALGGWSVAETVPPDLVASTQYIRFQLPLDAFDPLTARAFASVSDLFGIADVATEGQVVAYAASAAAEAGVRQLATARADLEGSIASLQTQVFAKIGDIGEATVAEELAAQALVTGQLTSTWAIRLTSGGFVSGLQAIQETGPGETVSELRISFDKFLVGTPATVSGVLPVYPFTISTVGGEARVAIRGDLLVDGSIGATKLVNSAAVITVSAQIASAVIESANIKDLTVETIKIKGDAITSKTSWYNSSSAYFASGSSPSGAYTLGITYYAFTVDQPVHVTCSASLIFDLIAGFVTTSGGSYYAPTTVDVDIYVDGSPLQRLFSGSSGGSGVAGAGGDVRVPALPTTDTGYVNWVQAFTFPVAAGSHSVALVANYQRAATGVGAAAKLVPGARGSWEITKR